MIFKDKVATLVIGVCVIKTIYSEFLLCYYYLENSIDKGGTWN
jgi:hypothetical protein